MKKAKLMIILSFVICTLYGQGYKTYYQLCYKADKEIYLENYKLALDNLEDAFAQVEYVHASQYKKASTCAVKIKDFRKGFLYAKKAILNGSQHQFWKDNEFKIFKKSKYYQVLKDSTAYFEIVHQKSINLEYKQIIDSLYFIDQYVVRKNKKAKENYKLDRSTLPKDLFDLDNSNTKTLLSAIEKYGFPSEKNIGLEGYEKASMIIHHNFRLAKNEALHALAIDALFKGEYLPSDFEGMYEQYNMWYKQQTFFTTFDKNLSASNLERINSNRLKYCLKDLSAYKIKRKGLFMKPIW